MSFEQDMLAAMPMLRAQARNLCRDHDKADDLVQTVLVKAFAKRHQFKEGTCLPAWLYTILRNTFLSDNRPHKKREVADPDGFLASLLEAPGSAEDYLDVLDVVHAMSKLSFEQHEALLLIASGNTYTEAASWAGCSVGGMKTRVHRARKRLCHILGDTY